MQPAVSAPSIIHSNQWLTVREVLGDCLEQAEWTPIGADPSDLAVDSDELHGIPD